MNDIQAERRRIVKQLLLAGFGVHLIGCNQNTPDEPVEQPEGPIKDTTQVEVIEEEFTYENVTFFTKEDERFDELGVYFNKHVDKTPLVIALVENEKGVAEAIHYAKENELAVSVKSGGHSFEGFSTAHEGLVIHLGLLKSIEWVNEEYVKMGPACLLREIYDATLPKKRLLPAGSCGTVGVGGLTLGGGYGLFARKYGLTCDHLVEATFVDGLGNIHELSGDSPLLWALRGGGNGNFGVVTSMTFKTHKAPPKFSTKRFKAYQLDAPKAKELLRVWFEHAVNLPGDCFSGFVLNGKTLTVLVTHFEDEREELQLLVDALTPITDKQTASTSTNLSSKLKSFYGAQKPLYFKNASAGYYNGFSDIEQCLDEVLDRTISSGLIYQINTLGGKINDPDFETNSSYPHRSYPFLSEVQAYWSEGQTSKRDRILKAFDEVQELLYENGNRDQYRNYPHIGFKDWETAYYGDNYERLQEFKEKCDPDNLFRFEQSVRLK